MGIFSFLGEKCAESLIKHLFSCTNQEKEMNDFLKGSANHSQFLLIFPQKQRKNIG